MAEAQASIDELSASDDLKRQLEANASTPDDELADEPETYDDLDPRVRQGARRHRPVRGTPSV